MTRNDGKRILIEGEASSHLRHRNESEMTATEERDNRKSVLVVTTVSSFLVPLALATVNIALPTIGREFGADAIALNWVATTYLLSAAMFLVPFGKVADMFGRRRIFLYGMCAFTVTSFFLGLARSTAMLIFFRALQGIGAAMIFGTAVAIVTSVFPPAKGAGRWGSISPQSISASRADLFSEAYLPSR